MNFKRLLIILASLGGLVTCTSSEATENGLTAYPVGVNTVLDGVLPVPGDTRFYNYTAYYVANTFQGPSGKIAIPEFRTSAFVDAPRIVHTWNQMLGPFTLSSGTVATVVHLTVDAAGASGRRTALGDLTLQPVELGYANPSHTFFAYFASDVSLPTGAYSSSRVANPGLNIYAWEPALGTTWLPNPQWEISTFSVFEVHSPDKATHYHSGSVAIFDYLAGYSVTPQYQIGIQGYLLKQFTDDTANGAVVADGFKGQAIAIGPQLRVNLTKSSAIVFKYQQEFAVRNRAKGEKLWVEISCPL
ncbi:SphA family protein [Burkholderia sp. PAMC 26561]|uniref:SphA family protein n=1 Tax=Burkholderia sp. PAMC 26561 TaxID=1795043 RepID=UPI00076B5CC1|nr:transporter [Burkholderia sp. PAMC 26561]AME28551.1 phenol degradation protein meta [Burkholderia sp. PAMC 26561]